LAALTYSQVATLISEIATADVHYLSVI
jgi:hypothetical protein